MYGDADEALKKRESVLYLSNHQSTGKHPKSSDVLFILAYIEYFVLGVT